MKMKTALSAEVNLVPINLRVYGMLKMAQKGLLVLCLLAISVIAAFTVKGFVEIGSLNREVEEDKKIIAEGHLDELNALKEQYDNLILGIDSGNITLIPDIKTKMTELFTIISKHKPEQASLTGVDGQLKSTGEYTYRMEYSSTDRTVIAEFLKSLQSEELEYINISTITKSVVDEKIRWVFGITVKIGGLADE